VVAVGLPQLTNARVSRRGGGTPRQWSGRYGKRFARYDLDYDRLDRAVDRAYTDVFGQEGDAQALRELLVASLGPTSAMPSAQAALLALRDVNAHTADAVLERAKLYYSEG